MFNIQWEGHLLLRPQKRGGLQDLDPVLAPTTRREDKHGKMSFTPKTCVSAN